MQKFYRPQCPRVIEVFLRAETLTVKLVLIILNNLFNFDGVVQIRSIPFDTRRSTVFNWFTTAIRVL